MTDDHQHQPGQGCAICEGETLDTIIDAIDKEVASGVLGFKTFGIFDPEGEHPDWLYTVGLWPDMPELVITGLPSQQAGAVMNSVVLCLRDDPDKLCLDEPVHDVLGGGVSVWFRSVQTDDDDRPLGMAHLYHLDEFVAWQVVWPDDRGLWPWDIGYDPRFEQTLLPPKEIARA